MDDPIDKTMSKYGKHSSLHLIKKFTQNSTSSFSFNMFQRKKLLD